MIKIKGFLFAAISMAAMAIAGCINTDLKTSISISLSSQDVQSTTLEGDEKIQATASCTGDHECTVNSVTISWTDSVTGQSRSKTFQLKKTVPKNGSITFDVVLIDNSDREYAPFSYLRASNPSTAGTGYTSYSESIAQPTFGSNVTTPAVNTSCTSDVTSIPVYDTVDPTLLIRTDSCVQFYLTPLTNYVRGTIKIGDFTQSMQETGSFGTLSGDGTGYLLGSSWFAKFNSGVDGTMGSLFVFYQKKSVGSGTSDLELSREPLGSDLRLVYGSTALSQSGTSLVDSTGIIYGYISGKDITLIRPLGYSDSDIVATYTGAPFTSIGGEVLGYGDGINTTYTFKTKYAPIYEGSLSVFTSDAIASIFYNKYTGELTATFSSPIASNKQIKASYRTSSTGRMAFTVKFDTDKGERTFPVYLQVNGS